MHHRKNQILSFLAKRSKVGLLHLHARDIQATVIVAQDLYCVTEQESHFCKKSVRQRSPLPPRSLPIVRMTQPCHLQLNHIKNSPILTCVMGKTKFPFRRRKFCPGTINTRQKPCPTKSFLVGSWWSTGAARRCLTVGAVSGSGRGTLAPISRWALVSQTPAIT